MVWRFIYSSYFVSVFCYIVSNLREVIKIIVAKGIKTGKVYAKGHTKANVCRYLDKHYKYIPRKKTAESHSIGVVYPEALIIEKE